MPIVNFVGLAGLVLFLISAWVKPIAWVRGASAVGGIAFVVFGLITAHYPFALICVLITIVNAWRYYEARMLGAVTRDATAASGAPITMDWLLPYMRPLALPAGTVVFNKGAAADAMYFVEHGRVRFEEIGVEMGKGALFGEIGIFSHDKQRTATAKTLEDSSLMMISADKVRELYYQNPDFGFFIVDLITRRLMEDAAAGTLKP
jgi:hypothetical protein